MQLLVDIYDDDDDAAKAEIGAFFRSKSAAGIDENESVIENIVRCYASMMRRVHDRTVSLGAAEAVPA